MPVRTSFLADRDQVAEQSTFQYVAVLEDEAGVVIPAAGVTTLTLTLYDLMASAQAIVNTVDHVNILNTGRGVLDSSGNLTITFVPADSQILDTTRRYEKRLALIEWTYGTAGAKIGRHEIEFLVRNMGKVP